MLLKFGWSCVLGVEYSGLTWWCFAAGSRHSLIYNPHFEEQIIRFSYETKSRINNFNTNYCNLRNLYCNTEDGCVVIEHDLESYEETYEACWQNKKSACIVAPPNAKVSVA